MSKRYTVYREADTGKVKCTVDGSGSSHDLRHVVRHSPDGFEIGYSGSGPTELSRCILIDFLGVPNPLPDLVICLREETIAKWEGIGPFFITGSSIHDAIQRLASWPK